MYKRTKLCAVLFIYFLTRSRLNVRNIFRSQIDVICCHHPLLVQKRLPKDKQQRPIGEPKEVIHLINVYVMSQSNLDQNPLSISSFSIISHDILAAMVAVQVKRAASIKLNEWKIYN